MSFKQYNSTKNFRVFILKNNEYIEISFNEFCRIRETILKNSKFIFENNIFFEVTDKVYEELRISNRHEQYLQERFIGKEESYLNFDGEAFYGEENLADPDENVVEQVLRKLTRESVRKIVFSLPIEERELIEALFYKKMTEREYANETHVSQVAVHYRKKRILNKLKNIFKNLSI